MSANDASMIVTYDSSMMLQIVVSLTDASIGIIYEHYMFIVQATGIVYTRKFFIVYELA